MKYVWQDLAEKKNLFTVKNTVMTNLDTGKTVQHYATNTKIVVVQKCVTPEKTYYRTSDAAHNHLNYAFEAEAFGLSNEKAPSVHCTLPGRSTPQKEHTHPGAKQKPSQKEQPPKDGERTRPRFSTIIKRRLRGVFHK